MLGGEFGEMGRSQVMLKGRCKGGKKRDELVVTSGAHVQEMGPWIGVSTMVVERAGGFRQYFEDRTGMNC